jgi:DNA mismatch repair protein MutS2
MPRNFSPGDTVHITALGTGILREVRNGGRCLVEIKGRAIVVAATQLQPSAAPKRARAVRQAPEPERRAPRPSRDLDLHGMTVEEAIHALLAFLNEALLAGSGEARIIHGRSGGTLKAAVHAQLRAIPSVRRFAVDPRNPGVTIAKL